MTTDATPRPCGICGSAVYELEVEGEMGFADVRPPIEIRRVCQNRRCGSNTGDMGLTDAV